MVLKKDGVWQISEKSDTAVLIGVAFVSLLLVIITLISVFFERSGINEYRRVEFNIDQVNPKLLRR
jgi:hypothetical protein